MLFLGHFSFDESIATEKVGHGYFTCIVEADTGDDAATKFKSFIEFLKEKEPLFKDVIRVYIEDLIHIKNPGDQPVLLRMQSSSGEFPESISYSFPVGKSKGMEAYGLTQNVEKFEDQAGEGFKEADPFIVFE